MSWSLSQGSVERFRRLWRRLCEDGAADIAVSPRVALADRRSPETLIALDLATGASADPGSLYDLIVVDLPVSTRIGEPQVRVWKAALSQDGVIAIRRRLTFLSRLKAMLKRRREDQEGAYHVRGLARSETAVRMAGLYVGRLILEGDGKREVWVTGSGSPLSDQRFRDHIGRVATDYLRCIGPVAAAVGL